MEYAAAAMAAIALIEKLMPLIQGGATVEQQAAVKASLDAIREAVKVAQAGSGQFSGPEWQVKPGP